MVHKKNVLVAGSSSAIAQSLIKLYRAQGHSVWTLGRSSVSSEFHFKFDLLNNSEKVDFCNQLDNLKMKFDIVYQCSGILHDEINMP